MIVDTDAPPAERVLQAECGHCWQASCAPGGSHLARWLRAERRGLISRAEVAAAIDGLTVITLGTVIPGGAP